MIQATKECHLTLTTTDESTKDLANMIHNMDKWLNEGLITKDTFIHIHNILRQEMGAENLISVVGYRDEREEKNEYSIRVVEFPEKADGNIHSIKMEDEKFFLVMEDKVVFEEIVYLTGKYAETIEKLKNSEIEGMDSDVEEVMDFISLYVKKRLEKDNLFDHKLKVSYKNSEKLKEYGSVLATITEQKEND